MRIEPLTEKAANRLLAGRVAGDRVAECIAARICADVERRGDAAVLAWARKLDGARAKRVSELRIPVNAIRSARAQLRRGEWRAPREAARNIRRVARKQLPRPWQLRVAPGAMVSQIVRPLDTVACYVPGGRFSLVSTLLMTAIPAQIAGVRRIIVACPRPNAAVLAAADLLGLAEVYQLGGAHAIAAFAFGTRTLPQADMICGPGNRFVAAAKKLVSSRCKIDMLAGPTELLVLAESGDARFIAADLIAQAEHDAEAVALLVTTSAKLARAVQAEVARQLTALPMENLAARALHANGRILLASTMNAAIDFANCFAPEHLSLPNPNAHLVERIRGAGSIFLGPWSAQPFGDYVSGTNHVLPTSGRARARGGLSATDFVKCITVQHLSQKGSRQLAPITRALARAEGLLAHERAVDVRTGPKRIANR